MTCRLGRHDVSVRIQEERKGKKTKTKTLEEKIIRKSWVKREVVDLND